MKTYQKYLMVVAVVCGLMIGQAAKATLIISDTFTASNGTDMYASRAPDTVNLPSGVYTGTYAWTSWAATVQGNQAQIGPDSGVVVPITSFGAYIKPAVLQISGDMTFGPIVTVSPPYDDWNGIEPYGVRGNALGLGFWDAPTQGSPAHRPPLGYSGLRLGYDGGLDLFINGVDQSQLAAYVGFFDTNAVHTLSYTVDTTSGAISAVLLDGQSKSFTTSGFTDGLTQYAGMDVLGNFATSFAYYDNFIVSTPTPAVPEPAVVTLMGLAGLLLRQWRRYFTPKR